MKCFCQESRFFSRHGDAFNIPPVTVYYLESRTDTELNAYVKEHLRALGDFMNPREEETGDLRLRYRLVYVPRATFDDGYAETLLSLRPDLKRGVVSEGTGATDDDTTPFDGSVICRLMPQSAHDLESRFLQTDIRNIAPRDFHLFLHAFVLKIEFNRERDYLEGTATDEEFTYWEPSEGVIVIKTTARISGVEDNEEREARKREREELQKRAERICAEIEALQRDNGINFLHEMLAQDTLMALCREPEPAKLSRLVITNDFSIRLADYDLDIHMNRALSKAFYILFLRHPEGIRLKEIATYKDELQSIYKIISAREDLEKMKKSINSAIDLEHSSLLYQHISRANKSFCEKLGFRLSKHYVINSDRTKASTIPLDRTLVTLPDLLKP